MNRIWNHFFFLLLFILVVCAAVVACMMSVFWKWGFIGLPILMFLSWRLYQLYRQPMKHICFLLDAIENNDHAIRFSETGNLIYSAQVNKMLNRIAQILYHSKQDIAQQEKYYELILNFVDTGIIVLNNQGAVYQKNKAALELLGLSVLTHLKQLENISPQLVKVLQKALPGDKQIVELQNERETIQLALRVSSIYIKEEKLRIVALSNINRELDEREVDAWIRLTKVLTHEIMNSLTPGTSLSEPLLQLSRANDPDLKHCLATIKTNRMVVSGCVDS